MGEYPIRQDWSNYRPSKAALLPNRRRIAARKRRNRRLIFCALVLIIAGCFFWAYREDVSRSPDRPQTELPAPKPAAAVIDSTFLKAWARKVNWNRPVPGAYKTLHDGELLSVETTLSPELQPYLNQILDHLGQLDRGRPRYACMVVMETATGRVIALGGYDDRHTEENLCLNHDFPAASLFKIVSAAGVIDAKQMSPSTQLRFNGGKYTLYKRQLRNKNNRYTNRISLERAFAESVNPVFGKIGAIELQQTLLDTYADKFGFNRDFSADLPVTPGRFTAGTDTYHWAELACGFNQDTRITPLHGVVLGAFPMCGGNLPEPVLIASVTGEAGAARYAPGKADTAAPLMVSPQTAAALKKMMIATVRYGTARKAFKKYRPYPLPAGLTIGGKTGSIGTGDGNDYRYDWFTGFADLGSGKPAIAVAVLIAHQKYLGTRAAEWSRRLMSRYFETRQAG
ncbi:MAG: PbpA [Deltaproteobacteria bacterium]|nr:MAG: PbpA [Deltaproteobacteria bacterium]